MISFLVYLPVPSFELAEPILKSAASFLEALGTVERTDVGGFVRRGRKKDAVECLKLTRFTVECEVTGDRDRARALEGVLRTTLDAARLHGGDVRVFVEQT